jgi:Uma2 family endonuclease
MGHALRKSATTFTYADYCRWPDDERWELIDGVAYAMAAPSLTHQTVVGELFVQISLFLRGKPCRPFVAPFDVRLPHGNEADEDVSTVVQPDITVVCDPAKLDEHGCRGAPDWAIEVLSPGTAAKDQIQKLAAYERAGVREVWLVHPTDCVVSVYALNPQGRYGRPAIHETIGTLAPALFADFLLDWDLVFQEIHARRSPPPTADAPCPPEP